LFKNDSSRIIDGDRAIKTTATDVVPLYVVPVHRIDNREREREYVLIWLWTCGLYVVVAIPLLTVAVVLALCLLVIAVACAVRYARKYCCCLAPRVGSYTPSPSPTTRPSQPRPHIIQHQPPPRRRDTADVPAKTGPAYRSVVIVGSDRPARRAATTKNSAINPHWVLRQDPTWGNLSQVNKDAPQPLPPPPPVLPCQTIVLGKRSSVGQSRDDVSRKTVPAMVSLLESRLNSSARLHGSQQHLN